MGSSLALRAAELVAAAVLAGTVLLTVMALGVWWLRRLVRRRLERLRLLLIGPAHGARLAGGAGSRWIWSLPLPDRRWWGGTRARRELWGAVRAAEHAVAAAHRGGAPTGDLEGLCQRVRRAAGSADCSLAIWQRSAVAGAGLEHPLRGVNDVLSAARQIQAAASEALASVSRPMARELADDVRAEVVALRAGIASAAGGRR